jgi:hypothetical protein
VTRSRITQLWWLEYENMSWWWLMTSLSKPWWS